MLLSLEEAGLEALHVESGALDVGATTQVLAHESQSATETLDLTDPVRYTALMGAVFEETLTEQGKRDTVHVKAVLRTDFPQQAANDEVGAESFVQDSLFILHRPALKRAA